LLYDLELIHNTYFQILLDKLILMNS